MFASQLYPLFKFYRQRGLDPLSSHWAARRDFYTPHRKG